MESIDENWFNNIAKDQTEIIANSFPKNLPMESFRSFMQQINHNLIEILLLRLGSIDFYQQPV